MKTSTAESSITNHPVVSHEQWVAERKRLLAREKELTHLRDQIQDFHVSFAPQEEKGQVDYNYSLQPFACEELPGISVFYQGDAGEVFHTYSTYGRGVEVMMGTYNMLDLTPKGRDESDGGMAWVRHHDRYEAAAAEACCHS